MIKDRAKKYKDADDVALMLIIGIVLNLIVAAILPSIATYAFLSEGSQKVVWFFYIPDIRQAVDNTVPLLALFEIILTYKIVISVLTISVIIPVVMDLRDTPIKPVVLVIITVVFMLPFAYLAYLWSPETAMIPVLLFLFSVLFFVFLLLITKGEKQK